MNTRQLNERKKSSLAGGRTDNGKEVKAEEVPGEKIRGLKTQLNKLTHGDGATRASCKSSVPQQGKDSQVMTHISPHRPHTSQPSPLHNTAPRETSMAITAIFFLHVFIQITKKKDNGRGATARARGPSGASGGGSGVHPGNAGPQAPCRPDRQDKEQKTTQVL